MRVLGIDFLVSAHRDMGAWMTGGKGRGGVTVIEAGVFKAGCKMSISDRLDGVGGDLGRADGAGEAGGGGGEQL